MRGESDYGPRLLLFVVIFFFLAFFPSAVYAFPLSMQSSTSFVLLIGITSIVILLILLLLKHNKMFRKKMFLTSYLRSISRPTRNLSEFF